MDDDPARGKTGLPAYAGMMADYHKAFSSELQTVIAATEIGPGMRVVDMACGDGSFTRWLADAVGSKGEVVAADICPAFLDQARAAVRNGSVQDRVRFLRMDLNCSPMADGCADLVWCAQSLQSLTDPVEAVRRMAGLMRPNGRLAVFESDDLHHVALSWPIDLELAVRGAEFRSFQAKSDEPRKFYVARDLPWVFREAGLACGDIRGFAFTRRAPFDPPTRGFLEAYLNDLRRRVSPFLSPEAHTRFDELVDPRSPRFLLDDPDALVVSVACLGLAQRTDA